MAETGSRSTTGVVISLARESEGTLRVIVDEVTADGAAWPQHWTSRVLLTHRDFSTRALLDNRIPAHELAELSELILAYLGTKLSHAPNSRT